ncbi:hypothetical protein B0T26DRAFT_773213, partial [Lasiosphaeria miniovina]
MASLPPLSLFLRHRFSFRLPPPPSTPSPDTLSQGHAYSLPDPASQSRPLPLSPPSLSLSLSLCVCVCVCLCVCARHLLTTTLHSNHHPCTDLLNRGPERLLNTASVLGNAVDGNVVRADDLLLSVLLGRALGQVLDMDRVGHQLSAPVADYRPGRSTTALLATLCPDRHGVRLGTASRGSRLGSSAQHVVPNGQVALVDQLDELVLVLLLGILLQVLEVVGLGVHLEHAVALVLKVAARPLPHLAPEARALGLDHLEQLLLHHLGQRAQHRRQVHLLVFVRRVLAKHLVRHLAKLLTAGLSQILGNVEDPPVAALVAVGLEVQPPGGLGLRLRGRHRVQLARGVDVVARQLGGLDVVAALGELQVLLAQRAAEARALALAPEVDPRRVPRRHVPLPAPHARHVPARQHDARHALAGRDDGGGRRRDADDFQLVDLAHHAQHVRDGRGRGRVVDVLSHPVVHGLLVDWLVAGGSGLRCAGGCGGGGGGRLRDCSRRRDLDGVVEQRVDVGGIGSIGH